VWRLIAENWRLAADGWQLVVRTFGLALLRGENLDTLFEASETPK
jgi:hypothetical protein